MLVVSWLDMDELQLYEDFFPPLGLLFLILHGLTDGDFLGPVQVRPSCGRCWPDPLAGS